MQSTVVPEDTDRQKHEPSPSLQLYIYYVPVHYVTLSLENSVANVDNGNLD